MEKIIKVNNPPGGNLPHTIRFQDGNDLRGHPSFGASHGPMAIMRNQQGFVIGGVNVENELVEADKKGGASRRLARIDAADLLGVSQDVVDN